MFLLGTRKESEVLIAIDVANGKERWATPIGSILNNGWGNGPRSTPAVDGNLVYAMGGRGNLLCANTQTGKMIWQVSMTDFGGRVPGWGYTESVLIDGNHLLCTPGGSQGAILALEKKTGEKIYDKVAGWGFTAAWQFLLLGLFYSLAHSFLEEYYWRWFVFDHLTRKVSLTNAVVISSIGFMAHHVILLATFFGWTSPMTYLFSIGIAIGGDVWALIYQLSGSLLGPWLSHLLVDAAIFLIGLDLVRERFGW
jgi:hypothetical protein